MPSTVLTLMAHPDDAEILCGGTLVLLARAGWSVHIATMTAGDCGSHELSGSEIAAVRRAEAAAAAALIGGQHHCLERLDLRVFYDEPTLAETCALVREIRPDVVITHPRTDYMLDHEQTSLLARAATFGAPIRNAPQPAQAVARPLLDGIPHLYYADPVEGIDPLGHAVAPTLVVDITTSLALKLDLLAEHRSQREWLRRHHGEDEYLESARRWASARGSLVGCEHGEGFRQHLGHAYPKSDALAAALPGLVRKP